MTDAPDKIQWHPSFFGATAFEFKSNKDDIEILSEYNLNKKPLRIDILIVKKKHNGVTVRLDNEIGHIMKTYNIIEYKSPDDSLTIDDFYKTLAYAYQYKATGKSVDSIDLAELTVSFFTERFPRKLINRLESLGYVIKKNYPGIYYISEDVTMIPAIQLIVIRQLSDEHSSFRILSKKADKTDIKRFIHEMNRAKDKDDKANADAVLQASISANRELYNRIMRGDDEMCEALESLMKDRIDEKVAIGMKKGLYEGLLEGNVSAIKNIICNLSYTPEQAMDLIGVPDSQRELVLSRLYRICQ